MTKPTIQTSLYLITVDHDCLTKPLLAGGSIGDLYNRAEREIYKYLCAHAQPRVAHTGDRENLVKRLTRIAMETLHKDRCFAFRQLDDGDPLMPDWLGDLVREWCITECD